jgi:hypothetical protein
VRSRSGPRSNLNDLELLKLETSTIFALSEAGRILHGRSPERGAGPRLSLCRSRAGNVLSLRHDVDDETAREIESVAAIEPALDAPGAPPVHLDELVRILRATPPDEREPGGPIYAFPERLGFEHSAGLVRSSTSEGDRLVAGLVKHGMPESLSSLGFVNVGEFWEPWCIGADGAEIAAIAFTVGMTAASAEVGVCSMVPFRGRGFAAAAVAGWASHPELRERTLFYSTSWSNVSSQRVTDRLGLRFFGSRLTID